jgi:hypothetical protein
VNHKTQDLLFRIEIDDGLLDHRAENPLLQLDRTVLALPDLREVLSQLQDLFFLLIGEGRNLRGEVRQPGPQTLELFEFRVPTPLELPGHPPVPRVHLIVLLGA